jgi:hypothetical protein
LLVMVLLSNIKSMVKLFNFKAINESMWVNFSKKLVFVKVNNLKSTVFEHWYCSLNTISYESLYICVPFFFLEYNIFRFAFLYLVKTDEMIYFESKCGIMKCCF